MTTTPETDKMILQALHGIRAAAEKTNERLDTLTTEVHDGLAGVNERVDALTTEVHDGLAEVNERVDTLRVFTVNALTELNHKVDDNTAAITGLTHRVDANTAAVEKVGQRFDHFLGGQGAKLVRRVDGLERELRRVAKKVDRRS